MEDLKKTDPLMSAQQLTTALASNSPTKAVGIGEKADLTKIEKVVLQASKQGPLSGAALTKVDQLMVEAVHSTLDGLSEATTKDVGFWQWLAIDRFRDFTLHRWNVPLPQNDDIALAKNYAVRFLGGNTLGQISRHAFRRYFVAGETLIQRSDPKPYKLVQDVFKNQTGFGNIFENTHCLNPKLAGALAKEMVKGPPKGQSQEKYGTKLAMTLKLVGSTLVLDYLSEPEISQVLKDLS